MTGQNSYSILKQLSILMALETGGAVAETVIYLTRMLMKAANIQRPLSAAILYVLWTLWASRMLSWSLTLVSLSRLADLRKSFRKARIWYLLRILFFTLTPLSISAVNYLYRESGPASGTLLSSVILFADLGLCLLAETLLIPVGNCAVLFAGAELLESFGMEDPARENRHCGKRLVGFALAEVGLWAFVLALLSGVWFARGMSLFTVKRIGDIPSALRRVCLTAFLGGFPIMACIAALRFLAAARIRRTYRAIEELTR